MLSIIKKRNYFLSTGLAIIVLSIVALSFWGLKWGIDFTGGSLMEVRFKTERPAVGEIRESLTGLGLGSLTVQPIGEDGAILRFQETDEATHQKVLDELIKVAGGSLDKEKDQGGTNGPEIEELKFDAIGPAIGQELKAMSLYAIIFVLIAIILYIAYSFRKVSRPVSSWKFGLAAIFALFHDVMALLGVFAVLGRFYNIEVNTPFVAAVLTVLGYSVQDTIVVFDRIRENLPRSDDDFEGTVNTSVNQTLVRSVNTSMTVLLALSAVIVFGGSTIRDFALALSIGIFVGTYSSIFLASPMLVVFEKLSGKNR